MKVSWDCPAHAHSVPGHVECLVVQSIVISANASVQPVPILILIHWLHASHGQPPVNTACTDHVCYPLSCLSAATTLSSPAKSMCLALVIAHLNGLLSRDAETHDMVLSNCASVTICRGLQAVGVRSRPGKLPQQGMADRDALGTRTHEGSQHGPNIVR